MYLKGDFSFSICVSYTEIKQDKEQVIKSNWRRGEYLDDFWQAWLISEIKSSGWDRISKMNEQSLEHKLQWLCREGWGRLGNFIEDRHTEILIKRKELPWLLLFMFRFKGGWDSPNYWTYWGKLNFEFNIFDYKELPHYSKWVDLKEDLRYCTG